MANSFGSTVTAARSPVTPTLTSSINSATSLRELASGHTGAGRSTILPAAAVAAAGRIVDLPAPVCPLASSLSDVAELIEEVRVGVTGDRAAVTVDPKEFAIRASERVGVAELLQY